MRKYETITRPAETYERLTEVTCDVCGVSIPSEGTLGKYYHGQLGFKTGSYTRDGSGWGMEYWLDLCEDHALQALGAVSELLKIEIYKREIDH